MDWITLITELGLPTVIIGAMGWFINKLQQQSKEREDKLMNFIAGFGDRLTSIEDDVEIIKEVVIGHQNSDKLN